MYKDKLSKKSDKLAKALQRNTEKYMLVCHRLLYTTLTKIAFAFICVRLVEMALTLMIMGINCGIQSVWWNGILKFWMCLNDILGSCAIRLAMLHSLNSDFIFDTAYVTWIAAREIMLEEIQDADLLCIFSIPVTPLSGSVVERILAEANMMLPILW